MGIDDEDDDPPSPMRSGAAREDEGIAVPSGEWVVQS
jgi:hypothetical protein